MIPSILCKGNVKHRAITNSKTTNTIKSNVHSVASATMMISPNTISKRNPMTITIIPKPTMLPRRNVILSKTIGLPWSIEWGAASTGFVPAKRSRKHLRVFLSLVRLLSTWKIHRCWKSWIAGMFGVDYTMVPVGRWWRNKGGTKLDIKKMMENFAFDDYKEMEKTLVEK